MASNVTFLVERYAGVIAAAQVSAAPFEIDAGIYYRGVVAWLQGGNPWEAAVTLGGSSYHYVGSPVTTVILAPASLLSEDALTAVWLALTWFAAAWTLRRLHRPLSWLLFAVPFILKARLRRASTRRRLRLLLIPTASNQPTLRATTRHRWRTP